VVFVLASTLMLTAGIKDTLSRNGGTETAVVIRKGSDNELSSIIDQNKVGTILSSPGVAKGSDGAPIGTGEITMIVQMAPLGDPLGLVNVSMRGVDPDALEKVRPLFRIAEGRMMAPGSNEAIVGRAIAGRFENFTVGDTVTPKKNLPLEVVGVFEVNGSSLESELWADVDTMRAAFGRQGMVSSVRATLDDPSSFAAFELAVESDKRLGLEAMTETQWSEKQSQFLATFVTVLGTVISVFFSIGAMIGAMITMYASIANRQKEIGTLRAIGFRRRHVLLSFIFESVLLALTGGLLGCLAALGMSTVEFSILNFATFSEMVFKFQATLSVFVVALVFTVGMGLFGGLLPAIRAARMSPVEAMRN
jgi:putative ABC transport system permease protein